MVRGNLDFHPFFAAAESQRKNVPMDLFDSDDDTSSISSSSTLRSERQPAMDEVQVHKDLMLDQSLDALYEKRLLLCLYCVFLLIFCFEY